MIGDTDRIWSSIVEGKVVLRLNHYVPKCVGSFTHYSRFCDCFNCGGFYVCAKWAFSKMFVFVSVNRTNALKCNLLVHSRFVLFVMYLTSLSVAQTVWRGISVYIKCVV